MRRAFAPLATIMVVWGCAGHTVGTSPTVPASHSPSPQALHQPYGVMVDILSSPTQYQIALVDSSGSEEERVSAAQRTPIALSPSGQHAADLPYVSTSLTSLYFLDGDSTVWRLVPGQAKTLVSRLPVGQGMEGSFAISPDDSQLAYAVLDFNREPVHVQLGLIKLGGSGQRSVTYDSDSNYVWPVAWHSGLLVLAHGYGPYRESFPPVGPFEANPYLAESYHLVDPLTDERRGLLAACLPSGPLVAAGTACLQSRSMGWDGSLRIWGSPAWHPLSAASLSPDGGLVAALEPVAPYAYALWTPDGRETRVDTGPPFYYMWIGWLDGSHFVTGSLVDARYRPVVAFTNGGPPKTLPDPGFFAARLPTELL